MLDISKIEENDKYTLTTLKYNGKEEITIPLNNNIISKGILFINENLLKKYH